jgi:hypothetical protein
MHIYICQPADGGKHWLYIADANGPNDLTSFLLQVVISNFSYAFDKRNVSNLITKDDLRK